MSTAGLFTPTEVETRLKSLSATRLEALAEEHALVIGGSGKGGNVTKGDYVGALAAFYSLHPTHVLVKIDTPYHNGGIENCAQWRPGEERILSLGAWAQVKADVGNNDNFKVVKKLVKLDGDDS